MPCGQARQPAEGTLVLIGEEASEGTEIQTVTTSPAYAIFDEKVIQRMNERNNKPVHNGYPLQLQHGGQ